MRETACCLLGMEPGAPTADGRALAARVARGGPATHSRAALLGHREVLRLALVDGDGVGKVGQLFHVGGSGNDPLSSRFRSAWRDDIGRSARAP